MSNAQSGTIALHHEGKVTIYDSGNIQSAVDASVKGDTLYLSEGTFGGFTITKGAVVIGSGQSTLISGDITISGNGTEENDGFVFSWSIFNHKKHLFNNFYPLYIFCHLKILVSFSLFLSLSSMACEVAPS